MDLRVPSLAVILLFGAPALAQQRPTAPSAAPPAPTPALASATGVITDSIRGEPLARARVALLGTSRLAVTDASGRFRMDSIPAGSFRFEVAHPRIDSLGIRLVTDPIQFTAGQTVTVDMATPSPARFAALVCPAAWRASGRGVLVGQVLDADTELPAESATVSLAWEETVVSPTIGVQKVPRVRKARVMSGGSFRICGLPAGLTGTLQAERGGARTAEVTISTTEDELVTISGLRLASADSVSTVAAGATDPQPGQQTPQPRGQQRGQQADQPSVSSRMQLRRGSAVVRGQVLDKSGKPVAGARVDMPGAASTAVTSESGNFVLAEVPAGTQSLVVRRLGYAPSETVVELSARQPKSVTIRLGDFVRQLNNVVVTARADSGLNVLGFTERKATGQGRYLTTAEIESMNALRASDVLRRVPGLRVVPAGGSRYVVQSTRSAGGCVNYVVDGAPFQSLTPGDVDDYLDPRNIAAIEVYQGSNTPSQFSVLGNSSCTTVVVWTKFRVDAARRQK